MRRTSREGLDGYRRLTFKTLDTNIVAVSPFGVWRVLEQAGLPSKWKRKPSKKGTPVIGTL